MEWVKDRAVTVALAAACLVALWPLRVYADAVGVSWFYVALGVLCASVLHWFVRGETWVRLGIVLAVVLAAAYVVFETESLKETEFQSRIRQLERRLADMAETSPARPELEAELERLRQRKLEDPHVARERAEELRAKLETLTPGTPAYRKTQSQLEVLEQQIPKWYDRFPLHLGLDLRGGTEVRLRIVSERQEHRVRELQEDLRELTPDAPAYEQALGDLTPGTDAYQDRVEELAEEREEVQARLEDARAQLDKNIRDAVEVMRRRLNSQGLSETPVAQEGRDRIRVQLPGMDSASAQTIIATLRQAGKLEFRLTVEPEDNKELYEEIEALGLDPNTKDICRIHGRPLKPEEIGADGRCKVHGTTLYDWLEEPAILNPDGSVKRPAQMRLVPQQVMLTGQHITTARISPSMDNPGYFEVEFTLDARGAKQFGRLTTEHARQGEKPGRHLAIILDGKLRSAPEIVTPITGGRGRITGNFTQEEAHRLSIVLKEGSLPVDIEIESENTVGPTLGEDSIRRGVQAIVAGLVLVLVFMVVYYLAAGCISDVGLFLNMLFILAILISAKAALTLPGIAGLILTVGMAVDANVLIFERIREELHKGASLSRAVENGYDRAFVTILDANITTLITAFILISFGTDAVKGFGTMLSIGILSSLFVSLFVTRAFFRLLLDTGLLKRLRMLQIVKTPSVDFVRRFRVAIIASGVLILAGVGLFVYREVQGRNYGHDLTGGTLAHVRLDEPLTVAQARDRLDRVAGDQFGEVALQSFGVATDQGYTEYVLRAQTVQPRSGETGAQAQDRFRDALREAFPLVPQGVSGFEKLPFTVEGRPAWELRLNLSTAMTPAQIQRAIGGALRNVHVRAPDAPRPEPRARTAAVVVALPVRDEDADAQAEAWRARIAQSLSEADTQGLLSDQDPVAEVAPADLAPPDPGQVAVRARLAFARAVTADRVRELFKPTDLVPMEVDLAGLDIPPPGDEAASRQALVLCTVSPRAPSGAVRADEAQEHVIRQELSRLRQEKRLHYQDPYLRFESVGPVVAEEMKTKALLALFYAMVAIFFYIWLRFQFRVAFGLGACVALAHDVLFTVGVLCAADEFLGLGTRIDLNIVAALLTIVGYSLNDTIVVFDRIRENLGGGLTLTETVNRSVNQTLSRTLLTSLTTMLVILALLVWGGEVIRGFALALFIGVLVGTYSSVFIASPILVTMERWARARAARQAPAGARG